MSTGFRFVCLFALAMGVAITGCGPKEAPKTAEATPPKREFVKVSPATIQGKWLSVKKLGSDELRSTYTFGADGKYSGEAEIRPDEKHVEAGTYVYANNTLTRTLTLNQMIRKGKVEKVSAAKLSNPIAWYSSDEFVFVGNEAAVWKRQP